MTGETGGASRGPVVTTLHALVFLPGSLTRARLRGAAGDTVSLGTLLVVFAALFFALTVVQHRRPAGPSAEVAAACAEGGGQPSALSALLSVAGGQGAVEQTSPTAARVLRVAERVLCDPAPFTRALGLAIPVALLLLMPLSAALMQAAFRKQLPGFAAHWVYGLEVHATLFLLLSVLALLSFTGSFALGFLASVGGLVYTSWNLVRGVQTAYGVSARAAAWKTTAVGVVYALVLLPTVVAVLWALLPPGAATGR